MYRSTSSSSAFVKVGSVVRQGLDTFSATYVDTSVTTGKTYYYRLACSNDLGESSQSASVKAKIL